MHYVHIKSYICIQDTVSLEYMLVNKDIYRSWGLGHGSNFWGTTIQLTIYRGESWIRKENYRTALSVKHLGLLC